MVDMIKCCAYHRSGRKINHKKIFQLTFDGCILIIFGVSVALVLPNSENYEISELSARSSDSQNVVKAFKFR